MKILVTGGNGFIGSQLVHKLLIKGYDVLATNSTEHDIRNPDVCSEIVKNTQIVVHLAASVGSLGYNSKHQYDIFYNNSIMALNLIHAAQKYNIEQFIGIGSIRSYSDSIEIPFKEQDFWKGPVQINNAAYAQAKRFMLSNLEFCFRQYKIPYSYLIFSNTYGPSMRLDDKITGIADVIRKIIISRNTNQKSIEFWGNGMATRDFLYVDDAVDSIIFCIQNRINQVLNVGSGVEISMKSIIEKIMKICGYSPDINWDTSKPEGDLRSVLNIEKIKEIGFVPNVDIETGLINTIRWMESQI